MRGQRASVAIDPRLQLSRAFIDENRQVITLLGEQLEEQPKRQQTGAVEKAHNRVADGLDPVVGQAQPMKKGYWDG